jgi:hypothetical protein
MQPLLLLFDQQLGVTNNIDEQDMPDLQSQLVVLFPGHWEAIVGESR